jgi:hypothetical protein
MIMFPATGASPAESKDVCYFGLQKECDSQFWSIMVSFLDVTADKETYNNQKRAARAWIDWVRDDARENGLLPDIITTYADFALTRKSTAGEDTSALKKETAVYPIPHVLKRLKQAKTTYDPDYLFKGAGSVSPFGYEAAATNVNNQYREEAAKYTEATQLKQRHNTSRASGYGYD